ncbi:NAD(P)-binding protein [Glonium stellatum]|uniref:NAD(P)-binding protein n=1 Tax=Glonium stellatum TaxID=574774 RepID=A0A8E2JY90_9PEZI|nr:NAD(P)-binding protein [Glonium stellatum]
MASYRAPFVIHNPVIRPGECILVTGANGYIASHLIDQLLAAGYRVRGTVRDLNKYDWVGKFFNQRHEGGMFELALVNNMAADGAFDEVIRGMSGVCHVAIGGFSVDPNVIDYTVDSTKRLFEAASRQPSVKRFVYTSSITAAFGQYFDGMLTVDQNTWNKQVVEMLGAPPPSGLDMSNPITRALALYDASKVLAEWEVYTTQRGSMEVNSVLPGFTLGKILAPGFQGTPSSAFFLKLLWTGGVAEFSTIGAPLHIDVEDCARLHIAALLMPRVVNQRIFAAFTPVNSSMLLMMLQDLYPDAKFRMEGSDTRIMRCNMPNIQAAALLRQMGFPGYTSVKDSVKRLTHDIAPSLDQPLTSLGEQRPDSPQQAIG